MRWRPNQTQAEATIVTTQDFITELFCRVDDQMRLAYTVAAFDTLVRWHGLEPDGYGVVYLSIAEFSL
jgi:hypothetical protein